VEKSMAKCTHGFCHRQVDETAEDVYCILHSPNPDKDREDFDKALAERPGPEDSFSYIVFPPNATFSNRTFTNASFFQTRFTGRVHFRNSIFKGGGNFQFAEFYGRADFHGTIFSGEVDFGDAKFTEDAQFDEAKFEDGAKFEGIVFPGGADFSDTRFGKESDFAGTTAEESEYSDLRRANFYGATFERQANFTCARFAYEGYFSHAEFTKGASFYRVAFTDKAKANFLDARFAKEVNFVRASLKNGGEFTSATFEQGAIFRGTIFAGRVVFDGANFLGRTFFEAELPAEEFIFAKAKEVFFTNVTIAPLDSVTFRDADLQMCVFQGTDLRKAEISGAKWPEMDRFLPLSVKRRGIFDEKLLLQDDKIVSWSGVEQVYRQLKQNHEDRRDYERANDFHYGEKEMRRKNPETSCGLKFLLSVYWAVSGYGERWVRPLVWAAILLILSAVGYQWWGLEPKLVPKLGVTSVWDYWDYSLRVMTHLKHDDLVPIGCAKYVNTFESIAGPVLLGLFGLALRQRLKR
jgi:uncharacterized protein YjbI with pentapeptide repeats